MDQTLKNVPRDRSSSILKDNENYLSSMLSRLFSNLPGFAYRCKYDADWTMIFISDGCKDVTGYQSEDLINNKHISYGKLIHEDDRIKVEKTVEKGFKEAEHFEMEYRIVQKNGNIRWVWERGLCLRDDAGIPHAIEGYIVDITQRKTSELELLESKQVYHDLVELSPDGIIILNLKGKITTVNNAFCQMAGYPASDFEGKFIAGIPTVIKGSISSYLKLFHSIIFNNLRDSIFFKFKNRDGDVRLGEGRVRKINMSGDTFIMGVIRDITDEDRQRNELISSKLKAEALLNASPDLMFVLDRQTKIIDYKSDPMELYYQKSDLLGKYLDTILPEDIVKMTKVNIQKTLASKEMTVFHYSLDIPNKGLHHYEARMVKSGRDEVTVIIRDNTEQKNMQMNLLEAKEKAEESNRLKSAFLANMSHEIRTPMNAIVGFSNLLQRNSEKKERRRYVDLIKTSSLYLLRLIDDVLFYSRLQSETIPVQMSPIDVKGFFVKLYETISITSKKDTVELTWTIPEECAQMYILSDYEKLWEIMTIFTSNALKYTDEGCIEMGVRCKEDRLVFYVRDTGIGISDKDKEMVFERFYRAEGVLTSARGGTGLGLSIAKELVHILNGQIGLDSTLGKGSEFYFDIPKVTVKSPETTIENVENESIDLKDFVVLIAEDDDSNFLYLNELMIHCVSRIDRAKNGQEAVDMVNKHAYDLILMDIKMPVMDGIRSTAMIKSKFPDIPVIVQTAYSQPEEKKEAVKAGADAYISKPIYQAVLQEEIKRICKVNMCD